MPGDIVCTTNLGDREYHVDKACNASTWPCFSTGFTFESGQGLLRRRTLTFHTVDIGKIKVAKSDRKLNRADTVSVTL